MSEHESSKGHGDKIFVEVGEGAQNVVAGKNIHVIQIGSIKVPIWMMAAIVVSTIIGVIVFIYSSRQTSQKLEKTSGTLAKISDVVLATPTTTPLPTPTFTPTPPRMASGKFNIAVAELSALDQSGVSITSPETVERANSIANFLANQETELTKVIGQQVLIWGPDQGVKPISPDTEAERTASLNANLIIYGNLHQIDENQWRLEPQFYLTDRAVGQANELRGEYALGREISYRTQSTASIKDLNTTLQIRLEALAKMLVGLSYLAEADLQDYDKAIITFQQIVNESTWARTNDSTGQEILYHFLGNAFLVRATNYADTAPERKELLEQSKKSFTQALTLNSSYVRSLNGLGAVDFQLARALVGMGTCEWNWSLVDEAAKHFQKALAALSELKPESGLVDLRAHFGLGRIHHIWGICPSVDETTPISETYKLMEQDWAQARQEYRQMLDSFESLPEPLVQMNNVAAYAHTDLGIEALIQAQFRINGDIPNERTRASVLLAEAIQHFQTALKLTWTAKTVESINHSIAVMPFYLNALCTDKQGKMAKAELEKFMRDPTIDASQAITIEQNILSTFENLEVVFPQYWKECIDE